MEEAAWAIIVQHLHHPRQICTLLCVSKEINNIIRAKCQGLLSITFLSGSLDHQNKFALWLSKYSGIVSNSLSLKLWRPLQPSYSIPADNDAVSKEDNELPEGVALTSALQSDQEQRCTEASQYVLSNGSCPSSHQQQLLQLQQEQYEEQLQLAVDAAASLLQLLPPHICQLTLHCDYYQQLADISAVSDSFQSLTVLQKLNLDSSVTVCAAPMFQALSCLPNLESLTVCRIISVGKLRHLPTTLKNLNLGICSPGLQLAHLTNLTSLRSRDRFLPLQSNDLLPPNLQELKIGECHSVQRLVQLKQLRSLDMGASNIPARRLLRLASSLTLLTDVKLSYHSGFNEAAVAWSQLPLRHLDLFFDSSMNSETDNLDMSVISAATVQELGKLSCLTYLHIQHMGAVEATKQQLADMLASLTALQELKLWSSGPWPLLRDDSQHHSQQQQQQQQQSATNGSTSTATTSSRRVATTTQPAASAAERPSSPGSIAVMRALAGLPNLCSVSLSLQNLGQAAAIELAAATKLTSLKLRACGVGDSTVEYLALHLTGLKCLFAEYNRDISDDVLPVLEGNLQQLTELDFRCTGVSESGKQYLRALQKLKQLQV